MKKFILFLILLFAFTVNKSTPQVMDIHGCDFDEFDQITGPFKPLTTPNSYIKILIVYVEFDNETVDTGSTIWPPEGTISYFGDLLAESETHISDWWNAYDPDTESLSSWFCEVSRGQLHVIGNEYRVVLDHDTAYYQNLSGLTQRQKEGVIN